MIRLGLQIPNFTYPGVATHELFERVAAIATTAETAGFDAVMVMDHFYQLPALGPPEREMLEAYTLLGALAARTSTASLGTLVTGVTYRNPAVLAKQVTALDVISRGRAFLGIGAAWFELEHDALGVRFPPVRERFEQLEDALYICRAMFRGERPTYEGKWHTVRDAINSPPPVRPGGPPIMVGGGGERRTLRLVAQHADMWNLPGTLDDARRKLEVLAAHCEAVGRDITTINKTVLVSLVLAPTMDEAVDKLRTFMRERGVDYDSLDDATRRLLTGRLVVGDADAVAERANAILDAGLDGLTFNMPADGHDLEAVAFAGEVLTKVLTRRSR